MFDYASVSNSMLALSPFPFLCSSIHAPFHPFRSSPYIFSLSLSIARLKFFICYPLPLIHRYVRNCTSNNTPRLGPMPGLSVMLLHIGPTPPFFFPLSFPYLSHCLSIVSSPLLSCVTNDGVAGRAFGFPSLSLSIFLSSVTCQRSTEFILVFLSGLEWIFAIFGGQAGEGECIQL